MWEGKKVNRVHPENSEQEKLNSLRPSLISAIEEVTRLEASVEKKARERRRNADDVEKKKLCCCGMYTQLNENLVDQCIDVVASKDDCN